MIYAMGEYYERVNDYDLEYRDGRIRYPFLARTGAALYATACIGTGLWQWPYYHELLHGPGDFVEGLDIAPEMLMPFSANWHVNLR